jgi:hypothetical protein
MDIIVRIFRKKGKKKQKRRASRLQAMPLPFFLCVLMASEVTQKIAEHRVAYPALLGA